MTLAEAAASLPVRGLVSVMMPAYNAAPYIRQAIESVLAQTYPHWELIVINDGSSDDTAVIAEQITDPRIRVTSQLNGGEGSARNHALQLAHGEWLAFLDADDLYLPDHLSHTVTYLADHPQCDAVYTNGLYIDAQGNEQQPLSSRRRGPFEGDIFEAIVRASDVFGPPMCVVLRREGILRRKLQFDPGIVIGPDWDFLTRYAEQAHFGYLDEITCRYRLHAGSISAVTQQAKRRMSLARCREKAIQLPRFAALSDETRVYAFYDLLVELLYDAPERQEGISQWPEFLGLAANQQARLLRLMAAQALRMQAPPVYVAAWLKRAARQNPLDWRAHLLALAYQVSPDLCRRMVQVRS